jgi:hypothetical protein
MRAGLVGELATFFEVGFALNMMRRVNLRRNIFQCRIGWNEATCYGKFDYHREKCIMLEKPVIVVHIPTNAYKW